MVQYPGLMTGGAVSPTGLKGPGRARIPQPGARETRPRENSMLPVRDTDGWWDAAERTPGGTASLSPSLPVFCRVSPWATPAGCQSGGRP